MSFQEWKRALAVGLLLIGGWAATVAPSAWGQEASTRKAKNKVTPVYPELARRMRISGVVKVQVTVAPNGTVKNARLVGGHPVLADAVMDVVKRWRYEAGPQETTENLEFRFNPND